MEKTLNSEIILKSSLVPKHELLSDEEKDALMKKYNLSFSQLPKIFVSDPAIKHLSVKVGDIVKITRNSPVAGNIYYYRGVVNE
jgi:DNA-directed RNA polymerase subunit H (RpoH/RPB5)